VKIKEVCEKTGLTDKAIRTYIKEGLINPEYDENYAGRRSYCFDDEDVEKLKNIVVLRKYNFSLKEINALFNAGAEADDLLLKHIEDMRNDVDSDIDIINSMINVSAEKPSNASELCKMLDTPEIANKPIPIIDTALPYKIKNAQLKKRNKKVVVMSVGLIILVGALALYIALSGFLNSVFQKNSILPEYKGFCIIESETKDTEINDVEYNYENYTDSIVLFDEEAEYLKAVDVNNRYVSITVNMNNKKPEPKLETLLSRSKGYNWDSVKYISIEAEYKPTKKYYKVIPILSDVKEKKNYSDIAYSSGWFENNSDYCYEEDYAICANGVFELKIDFVKQ
jgi:DNA-binding transcriptional MerR regulator